MRRHEKQYVVCKSKASQESRLHITALVGRVVKHRGHESTHIPARAVATQFEQLLLRQPYIVLAVCFALTVGAMLVGWRVRFDSKTANECSL